MLEWQVVFMNGENMHLFFCTLTLAWKRCHVVIKVDNSVKLIWFAWCGNSVSRVYFDLTEDEDVKTEFGRLSAMKVKKLCVCVDLFSFLGYPDTLLKAKFTTCRDIFVLITLANYPWAELRVVYHGGSIWLVLGYWLFLNVQPVFCRWYNYI